VGHKPGTTDVVGGVANGLMSATPAPHYTSRMSGKGREELILAVDVGATFMKFAEVSPNGALVSEIVRRGTPYPCSPARLVAALSDEVGAHECRRVGVGFPGAFAHGRVIEPGNLSRPGGITTDVDAALHDEWVGYGLLASLVASTARDVRVVNDATLAALGCSDGEGRELVFTLGTGMGIALVVQGEPTPIRDVGAEAFVAGRTYDQLCGEAHRVVDEQRWADVVFDAISGFVREFSATVVHIGGGNAARVDPGRFVDLGVRVAVHDNMVSLRGAARLFRQ
jgi:polyphosphate glucokinase